MFYFKNLVNPVSGKTEKHFVKVLSDGSFIAFGPYPGQLMDDYEAWVKDGNTATEWTGY